MFVEEKKEKNFFQFSTRSFFTNITHKMALPIPNVTPANALKAHAIVSVLFSLPVVISGAGGFIEMVSDGAVKASQLKGPIANLLTHITYVDFVKNLYISLICWTVSSKAVTVQKVVCKINVLMMVGATLALKYSPPVAGGPLLPPPALAYFSVMSVLYCLALKVPQKALKMLPSLPKIGGGSSTTPAKRATPARRASTRRR